MTDLEEVPEDVPAAPAATVPTHVLIPLEHVAQLHKYMADVERHGIIDWQAFRTFVGTHFRV